MRTIAGYTLGPLLGRGGASEVYAARDEAGGEVAIKLLAAASADRRARLIEHPNVVRVLACGADYVVMERLHGEDLATRLRRLGPLAEAEARRIGAAIADGAAAAHACGIVHRDLKPANVMIEPSGGVKLVDFGIAKSTASAIATGPRMGTPAYMAPEQMVSNLTTPTVDVFALGVILYEMVTGAVPFDCTGGAAPQLTTDAPRLAGAYGAIVAACLAREPAQRIATMAELAQRLRGAVVEDRVTEALGEPPPPAREGAQPRRSRRLALAGAAVVAVVTAVAVLAASSSSSSSSLSSSSSSSSSSPSSPPALSSPVASPPAASAPTEPAATPTAAVPATPARPATKATKTKVSPAKPAAPARPAGETLD